MSDAFVLNNVKKISQNYCTLSDNKFFTSLCKKYIVDNGMIKPSDTCNIFYSYYAGFSFIRFKNDKNIDIAKFQISNLLYGLDLNNNYFKINECSSGIKEASIELKSFYVDTEEIGKDLLVAI